MKKIPAQLFSFDLVHAHCQGFYLGVTFTVLISWGGGGGIRLFYSLGGSCTVSWGRLRGKFSHRFGGGGGTSPAPPTPLD